MGDLDTLVADALRGIDQGLTSILGDGGDVVRGAEAGVTFVCHDAGKAQARHSGDGDGEINRVLAGVGSGAVLTGIQLDVTIERAVIGGDRLR